MMTTENLTSSQIATLAKIQPLLDTAVDGEISEFAARSAGAHLASLRALVRAGVITVRRGPMVAPEGHACAGEMLMSEAFYAAA
jgi:hypothetical protein